MATDPKQPKRPPRARPPKRPEIRMDDGSPEARKRPKLDLRQVEELARIGCTQEEAAGVFRLTRRAFEWQLAEHPEVRAAWEYGQADGKRSLRRRMVELANSDERGNVQAAIHLCKTMLGETEKAIERRAGMNDGVKEFDPAKLDRLTTEEKVLLAGFLAKLSGEDASGATRPEPGSLH